MSGNASYQRLLDECKRLHRLSTLQSLLSWDEQVNLPAKSSDLRAEQSASLATLLHRERTRPEMGELLETLSADKDLDASARLVVEEARRDFLRATRLPSEFVERRTLAHSRAFHAWADARRRSDFKSYQPFLEENLRLAVEEVSYQEWEKSPYDYWIDTFDPGVSGDLIEGLFLALGQDLVPVARNLWEKAASRPAPALKGFPEAEQEAFLRKVIQKLGFDFDRGRLDRSLHPFCSGCGLDIRMTTRFHVDVPLDSLFSSIHETGHGLYEQGLPLGLLGTALGEAAGMAVHESQSRLYENQVGRSRPFWKFWSTAFRGHFPEQLKAISDEALYLAINAVGKNPIRVDSDEVSYNLHIILRFRLEKALFDGSLKVADLPQEWGRLSRELLDLEPAHDAEGVLQDVHWSGGAFGYFPSYCLGNMLAAQLWNAYRESHPDWESAFSSGDFSELLLWLRETVHRRGKQVNAQTLPVQALGQPLSPTALIQHLKERYEPLYS